MTIATDFLQSTDEFLRTHIAPQAERIDQDPVVLYNALKLLGERSLLALRLPREWQGQGVDELTFARFQEILSRYSGALAFLQTQHQSAGTMLAQSPNTALMQQYLPGMSQGKALMGVGFSQLRRVDRPAVKAHPIPGGYTIHGEVPWVTGYGCFPTFILGATLPDGRSLFGIVPLSCTQQSSGRSLRCSLPMALAAMASTQTVSVHLSDWFLPEASVVFIKPVGWIQNRDRRNVLRQSFFALGCAQAGLDIVRAAQSPSLPEIDQAGRSLHQALDHCRQAIYAAQRDLENPIPNRLQLRAEAIDLAVRCAHAAVTVSRGAANYSHHPAQRIYREALALTIFGQTPEVMTATLAQLTRSLSPMQVVNPHNQSVGTINS